MCGVILGYRYNDINYLIIGNPNNNNIFYEVLYALNIFKGSRLKESRWQYLQACHEWSYHPNEEYKVWSVNI